MNVALGQPVSILLVAVFVLILMVEGWLLVVGLEKPKEFFPDIDPKGMYVNVDMPEGAADMPGIIVPRKAVGELRKLIDEYEGDVQVSLSDTKIRFTFADVVLTSKLIDGTFPDYSRVIPEGNDKNMEVDSKILAEAVDRVSTISSDKTRSVKLGMETGQLKLSVNSPEHGTATEELSVSYESDEMEIGFNSRYLLDILAQIEGDVVQVAFADAAAPTILKDLTDEGALYVLMPMRV
jgi:DNA polymerase-3 subunit beta